MKALTLVYDNSPYLSFDELLIKDKSVSIHQINLQFIAAEIFMVKNGVSARLAQGIFQLVNKPYDLQNISILLKKEIGQFFSRQ